MTDHSRLEDLRRRVHKDPASIAFAQLAEECRRAGLFQEAISVSQAGLERHPAYPSARVTLGRALLQIGQLDAAFEAFDLVRRHAPLNLAAIRGLADVEYQRAHVDEALSLYRRALELAPNDPELERLVTDASARAQADAGAAARRAAALVGVLEQWLAAIHVARAERFA